MIVNLCEILPHARAPLRTNQFHQSPPMSDRENVFKAIKNGNVKQIYEWIADPSFDARWALVRAARCGALEIVELLLKHGASINDRDVYGITPLIAAISDGPLAMVEWLIARHADLSLTDRRGRSPLETAMLLNKGAIVNALLKAGAPTNVHANFLVRAAAMGALTVLLLIERGVDIRSLHDTGGHSPLHHVAYAADSVDLVRLLVEIGVDVDSRNGLGNTAAHACAQYNHVASLRFLIGAGADIALADAHGNTPLHNATWAKNLRSVVVLLAGGADVNATNIANETPCAIAVRRPGQGDVLRALLAAGADFDALDNDGRLTLRETAALTRIPQVTDEQIAVARQQIVSTQLDFVRQRAFQVCVGLQPLNLDALQTCEILLHACGPVARFVPFHSWWTIATLVKHFV